MSCSFARAALSRAARGVVVSILNTIYARLARFCVVVFLRFFAIRNPHVRIRYSNPKPLNRTKMMKTVKALSAAPKSDPDNPGRDRGGYKSLRIRLSGADFQLLAEKAKLGGWPEVNLVYYRKTGQVNVYLPKRLISR